MQIFRKRPAGLTPAAGGRRLAAPVRGGRTLLHRGHGLLRRPRTRRLQPVPDWAGAPTPCSCWAAGTRRPTSAPGCWAPRLSPVNQLNPLRVLARSAAAAASRGWESAGSGARERGGVGEPAWIVPMRTARTELRWVAGSRTRGAGGHGGLRPGGRPPRSVAVRVAGHLAAEAAWRPGRAAGQAGPPEALSGRRSRSPGRWRATGGGGRGVGPACQAIRCRRGQAGLGG